MPPASKSTRFCRRFRSGAWLALGAVLAAAPLRAETKLSLLTQVDWVLHRQSSQDELDPATRTPLNEDRLLLRRGRLGGEATQGALGARLELDLNTVKGLNVRPFEALVFARYRDEREPSKLFASASAGLMRIPFGFDAQEPDAARPLLERALGTRAFFGQARDFGVGADAGYRFARLSLALMNGEPLSDERYAGLDPNRGKDFVARAGMTTDESGPLWARAGISCLFGRGFHAGTAATKDSLQWVDGNEDGLVDATELIPIAGAPATASQNFDRSALGADLRVGVRLPVLGLLTLRTELVRAINLDRSVRPADPVASGRDLRELAVQVGASLELTRFAEAAVRYDVYEPDADATRQRGAAVVPRDTRYRTLALSLSGKLPPGRVLLEYDHQRNALGRSPSGAPTTLKDDALTLRFEVRL